MGNKQVKEEYENIQEVKRVPTKDLYSGCLLGQALADSLGFLVEGEPPEACTQFVQEDLKLHLTKDNLSNEREKVVMRAINKNITLGQVSDDSQMAVELMASYNACRTFKPEAFAKNLSILFSSGTVVGCGLATAKSVAKLQRGISWDKCGMPKGAAGNGAAIRAAPIGLVAFDDVISLVSFAKQQSFVTHQDERCQASSIVIAGAVALCITHSVISPFIFLDNLISLCQETSKEFAESLIKLKEWIVLPAKKACLIISKHGMDYDDGSVGISGFVTSSVLWALYCFLNNRDDYWSCISMAISAGGDSTAAMAGALSGAYLGLSQLPPIWLSFVHDNQKQYSYFLNLSESCFDIKRRISLYQENIASIYTRYMMLRYVDHSVANLTLNLDIIVKVS